MTAVLPHDAVVRRGDGEPITDTDGREVRLLVAGDELAITWSRFAAGERGPDLHVHHEHSDAFYVIAGALTFELGPDGRTAHAPAGAVVVVPPDVPHGFRNDGPAEAVFLNLHAPDGDFAAFLRARSAGRPASFDSYDLPVDSDVRPAADATLVPPDAGEPVQDDGRRGRRRYDGPDLRVVAWTDGAGRLAEVEATVPGTPARARFVLA